MIPPLVFLRRVPFEITTRTITKSVTFHRPFCLKGVDRLLPPADYRVVTGEEVIEGLSFTAYDRISTVIFVPAEAGCAVEMMTIDPMDLQTVHKQDVAMLAVHSVVGRPTNTAAS
jgi:hypothetical protein